MITPLLALSLLASLQAAPAAAAAEPGLEYFDAKKLADADEASVTGPAHDAMLADQRKLLDAAVEACAQFNKVSDFTAFTVVMRLDADGRVQKTWREGMSPLALCVQGQVRGKIAFVPPKAPFYSALEVSFTK